MIICKECGSSRVAEVQHYYINTNHVEPLVQFWCDRCHDDCETIDPEDKDNIEDTYVPINERPDYENR